ncbi:MAG TPA: ribosomal RNA small subunit methyltransferase A [Pyrodictium sp.]|nr:ribosomal RNA small subunit methyltransferase A [Pyrodictium sp.]
MIKPLKKLGQHFLRDRRALTEFARYVCGSFQALEIGVGYGTITLALNDCVGYIVGIEIDSRFTPYLQNLQFQVNVDVVLGDAISPPVRLDAFDVVYGAIPYNITGPLLSMLARWCGGKVVLLIQREVAQRLAANPGSNEYGRITVLISACYNVKLGGIYGPKSFAPPPKVYSRFVVLEPKRRIDRKLLECLERVTQCLFSGRRKLAKKMVKKCFNFEIDLGDKRVYELPLEVFLEIARKVCVSSNV